MMGWREAKTGQEHPLVEIDVPGPRFQEDVLIRSGKMKVYG